MERSRVILETHKKWSPRADSSQYMSEDQLHLPPHLLMSLSLRMPEITNLEGGGEREQLLICNAFLALRTAGLHHEVSQRFLVNV